METLATFITNTIILGTYIAIAGGIPVYLIILGFKYLRLKIKLLEKRIENEHL